MSKANTFFNSISSLITVIFLLNFNKHIILFGADEPNFLFVSPQTNQLYQLKTIYFN